MINFVVWLIAGAVIGGLATVIVRDRSSLKLNIVVGIVCTILTGFLLAPMIHLGTINQEIFNIPALLVSLGTAVVVLSVVNLNRFYKNRAVSNEVITSKWKQVRDKIPTRWTRLTEDDIDKIDGKHDQFISTLQERYGCAKEQAEDQLQGYLKAITRRSKSSFLSSILYDRVRNSDSAPSHDHIQ